jgi:hypothetical protein
MFRSSCGSQGTVGRRGDPFAAIGDWGVPNSGNWLSAPETSCFGPSPSASGMWAIEGELAGGFILQGHRALTSLPYSE